MEESSIVFKFQATGIEEIRAQAQRLGVELEGLTRNTNGTFSASGRFTGTEKEQAAAVSAAGDAVNKASTAHKNYFAHITRTTIQSALVNKAFMSLTTSMGDAVKQVDLMQTFPASMAALGLSSKDAADSLLVLRDYAGKTGISLTDATTAVARFAEVSRNVKAATAEFVGARNALIAGGAGAEVQKNAMEQLIQAYSRGVPQLIEWRSLMVAMPAQLNQVAKAMDFKNAQQLGEALTNGKVSMQAFVTELTKMGISGKIADQAVARMQGIEYASNVMKQSLTNGLAAIYQAIGRQNIISFFQFMTQAISATATAVVWFINLMISLANIISKVFGGGQIAHFAGETAQSLDDGASGAGNMADNLDDANDSAKELNKSLASFDKMNVLDKGKDKKATPNYSGGLDPSTAKALEDQFGKIPQGIGKVTAAAKILGGVLAGLLAYRALKFVWDLAGSIISGIRDVASGILAAKDGAIWLGKSLVNLAKFAWTSLVEGATQLWINLKYAAELAWTKLTEGLKTAYDKMVEIAKFSWEQVKAGFQKAVEGAQAFVNKLTEIIVTSAKAVAAAVRDAAAAAAAWVANAAKVTVAWARNMALIVIEFAAAKIGAVTNAAITAAAWVSAAVATTAAWIIANAAILGVIGLIILLVAGMVIVIVKNWDTIKNAAIATWQAIQDGIAAVIEWVKNNWPLLLAILTGPIGMAAYLIIKNWDTIKAAFNAALDAIKLAWGSTVQFFKDIWAGIVLAFAAVGTWFASVFQAGWNGVKAIWNGAGDFFVNVWNGIKTAFGNVGAWFSTAFQSAWNAVTSIFGGLWAWFRDNVWNRIVGVFSSIGSSIGDAISGAFKGIMNTTINFVSTFINNLIRAINGAIGIINKIPGVRIANITEVTLPRLARGGIVDQPTIAQIGEQGKEAIMPLENNTEWIDELAGKINSSNGNSNGQPIQLTVQIGEDRIATKIINLINEKTQMSGRNAILV